MFIPINTDAPVYYFPAATLGLIATNVLAFLLTGGGFRPDLADPWILWFGEIHPTQWLTASFMHAGFMHLIGNMIFLWAFGLVVEGKLGWSRFLPLYLLLAVSQNAVHQCIMLGADRESVRLQQLDQLGLDANGDPVEGSALAGPAAMAAVLLAGRQADFDLDDEHELTEDEMLALEQQLNFRSRVERGVIAILKERPLMFGALGASGVIYSLLAMSLIWAPKNEITVVGLLLFRPVSFEITIMWFATWYIGIDAIISTAEGFSMSTSFLHSMGAITGAVTGVALLKLGKVDCEDWDLFAVLSGRYGPHVRDIYGYRSESGKRTRYDETPAPTPNLRKKDPLQNVTQSISQGHFSDAAEKLFAVRIDHPRAKLSQQQLRELAEGLVGVEDYEEAESILEEYIERHPDDANWACLRLAAIQLQINGQPRAALQTLKHVHRESLTDSEKQIGRKLSTVAKEQIRAGVQDRQPEW